MSDLTKDVDRYRGVPPYASDYYGVYQPLLGWESALSKKWLRRGRAIVDPRCGEEERSSTPRCGASSTAG